MDFMIFFTISWKLLFLSYFNTYYFYSLQAKIYTVFDFQFINFFKNKSSLIVYYVLIIEDRPFHLKMKYAFHCWLKLLLRLSHAVFLHMFVITYFLHFGRKVHTKLALFSSMTHCWFSLPFVYPYGVEKSHFQLFL